MEQLSGVSINGTAKEYIRLGNFFSTKMFLNIFRNKDHGYFCRAAIKHYAAHERPIWIVSDCRRPTDIAFFESTCFESAIRNAISLGGDADTMACISGGLAEAFYGGVPEKLASQVLDRLPKDLHNIAEKFTNTYCVPSETSKNAYSFLIHTEAYKNADNYRQRLLEGKPPGARLATVLSQHSPI